MHNNLKDKINKYDFHHIKQGIFLIVLLIFKETNYEKIKINSILIISRNKP